jgi:hypothetical protein
VNDGFAKYAPRRAQRQAAVTLQLPALVEWNKTLP